MYRSDKRLLLTEDGEIVGPEDPRGKTLLVAEGGELSYPEAMKHGLVPDRYAVPTQEEEKKADAKAESLPLPTSAATAEKASDVLPKSLGTETKTETKETKAPAVPPKDKVEKK